MHLTGSLDVCKALMLKTVPEGSEVGPPSKILAQARLNLQAMEA